MTDNVDHAIDFRLEIDHLLRRHGYLEDMAREAGASLYSQGLGFTAACSCFADLEPQQVNCESPSVELLREFFEAREGHKVSEAALLAAAAYAQFKVMYKKDVVLVGIEPLSLFEFCDLMRLSEENLCDDVEEYIEDYELQLMSQALSHIRGFIDSCLISETAGCIRAGVFTGRRSGELSEYVEDLLECCGAGDTRNTALELLGTVLYMRLNGAGRCVYAELL